VACLGLTDGRRGWLFDATPDLPDQVHELGVGTPTGIFLTHAHMGHYTGLVHLGREALDARGVTLYVTPSMGRFLHENEPWNRLIVSGTVSVRDAQHVDLGGVRVRAFPVPHRAEFTDTVAYRIDGPNRSVLYVPDIDAWETWDRDVVDEVRDVDVAFLDGTFWSGAEIGHRDAREVPHPFLEDSMARLAPVAERVRFLHLNHTNPVWDDESLVTRQGFAVAREGEVHTL
jgi:pyrroloquinoline quinone biosynthesis protein B